MAKSLIASIAQKFDAASGTISLKGLLSASISVKGGAGGGATVFNLYAAQIPLSDLDAPINLPYYDYRDTRRDDAIPFTRVSGTGYLVILVDQDLTCQ